ncbi:MAG: EamA family transporter [Oscillatoria sp. SIO1A7]|nr:EamA family transporter [Oscillatoria sp. SIO1A7]
MGPLDNLPENSRSEDPRELQNLLVSMTQEIRNIQQNLTIQLTQDVARLQAEKNRLMDDISNLQSQHKQLLSRQMQTMNQRQMAQQQVWSKQLAQVLASHLQEDLSQKFKELVANGDRHSISSTSASPGFSQTPPPSNFNDNAYRLLASLDNTLNTTFKTLQQELSSYQSSLSQQLGRMHSLQQQGEVILETLVDRLISQLQEDAASMNVSADRIAALRQGDPSSLPEGRNSSGTGVMERPRTPAQETISVTPQPRPAPPPPPPAPAATPDVFKTGLILVLLSSLTISFQNIVTRVILFPREVFLFGEIGGVISPGFGNSLLVLAIRMTLVAPVMLVVSSFLYKNTFKELRQLGNPEKRGKVWIAVGSGLCLFFSQCFIYVALGMIPTGVATAIFFVFPTVTILLAWLIFGARPTFILALATVTIYVGCFLTIPEAAFAARGGETPILQGALAAALSGTTFAGYVIMTQLSAKKLKLHPAPFSVVNFTVNWLGAVVLLFVVPFFFPLDLLEYNVDPQNWGGLLVGCFILFLTTLVGYLLNNYGIPMIGPSLASVVSATGPALTSVMALTLINENLVRNQWIGVGLVTLWVLGISVENMNSKKRAAGK